MWEMWPLVINNGTILGASTYDVGWSQPPMGPKCCLPEVRRTTAAPRTARPN